MTETAHGMPSSRLTMMAWLNGAPTFTTTPPAGTNSGVHDGSVMGATRMSPGSRFVGSAESSTTRARPTAVPGHPGIPWRESPGAAWVSAPAERGGQVSGVGWSPTKRKGSSSADSSSKRALRSAITSRCVPGALSSASCSSTVRNARSVGSSICPLATQRRPSSRLRMRISCTSFTQLVLVRSRPGMKIVAALRAARNWPWASGSPSIMAAISVPRDSRSAARAAFCSVGAALSSASRMRSMAASAMCGSVSQVGQRTSHSFGPRDP